MIAASLALVGAMIWGGADFLGGLAAKRMAAVRVTFLTGMAALVLLLPAQLLVGGAWSARDTALGAMVGALYAVGLVCLYAAFAAGPMVILSPLAAVLSAVVPSVWAVAVAGESPGPLAWAGTGLAVSAVVLIARARGERAARPRPVPLLLTIVAGVAFGAFVITLDQTAEASGLTPLIASRVVLAALCGAGVAILALRRGPAQGPRSGSGLRIALAAGVCDAAANVLILVALRTGDLAVVGVLQALYPAGTVLLAALVLRERLAAPQAIGLVLALVAAALFALA
ncbi:DMT family transporter [Microbacterium sp. Marseille-Q6965]|uniref:DMT family transporter n=1 Tax=Microbacterium sp. Marseille-Q6965 TaxID=2965072 RepID=UPI0021B8410D|nr:DMT family transporter [Microbacterium sp. Marseille-Q6965]